MDKRVVRIGVPKPLFPHAPPPLRPSPPLGDRGPRAPEALLGARRRLEPDRYSILWVRHLHAGHHELHFVTPRVELVTGKSLNIHPPGRVSQALYDTFRSMINAEYGLADPDDPARVQDVRLPNHLAKLQAHAQRQEKAYKETTRQVITAFIRREIDAGRIKDRAGVETYLTAQGFTLTRVGEITSLSSILARGSGSG